MDLLTISIVDSPVTLRLDECVDDTRRRLHEHYAPFAVPPDPRAPEIDLRVEPGPAYLPVESARTWQAQSALQADRIEFRSFFEQGYVSLKDGQGSLVMRPHGDPENFLRVVYAWLCLRKGALLLHASGIIRGDRGYVFFGPSGSGKTTITRLSQAHTVLSDDMVILAAQNGRWRVHGVPFRGAFLQAPRTNAVADLYGLCALVKDSEHRVTPVAPAEAVARLAGSVPFVMTGPENTRRVTEICTALHAAVPVRALHFRQDSGFWEVLDGPR